MRSCCPGPAAAALRLLAYPLSGQGLSGSIRTQACALAVPAHMCVQSTEEAAEGVGAGGSKVSAHLLCMTHVSKALSTEWHTQTLGPHAYGPKCMYGTLVLCQLHSCDRNSLGRNLSRLRAVSCNQMGAAGSRSSSVIHQHAQHYCAATSDGTIRRLGSHSQEP